jgi:hypothetical protein
VADRKALLCWQVISLLKYDGYFLLIFTEKRLRNRSVILSVSLSLCVDEIIVLVIIKSNIDD